MKLRKPCSHDRYDAHVISALNPSADCPGGVFLPDDTLIIEKVDGKWPEYNPSMRYWHSLFDVLLDMQKNVEALSESS